MAITQERMLALISTAESEAKRADDLREAILRAAQQATFGEDPLGLLNFLRSYAEDQKQAPETIRTLASESEHFRIVGKRNERNKARAEIRRREAGATFRGAAPTSAPEHWLGPTETEIGPPSGPTDGKFEI